MITVSMAYAIILCAHTHHLSEHMCVQCSGALYGVFDAMHVTSR